MSRKRWFAVILAAAVLAPIGTVLAAHAWAPAPAKATCNCVDCKCPDCDGVNCTCGNCECGSCGCAR